MGRTQLSTPRPNRNLGDHLWKRFNASREDQLWYYRGLVTALRQADGDDRSRELVNELDRVVTALELEVRTGAVDPRKRR